MEGGQVGVVQPGQTAAQAHQVLVEAQRGRPQVGHVGGGRREGRADLVVPAQAVLLDPPVALLVAVVDGGQARQGGQQRDRVGQVGGLGDLGGDAGGVVVAQEGPGHQAAQELGVTPERPVQLVEVPGLDRGPDGLPQLVLRHRVHARGRGNTHVVPVDDLPHEVGLRVVLAHPWQHPGPEGGVDGVGRVQPPGVGPALQPELHDLDDHVGHGRLGVVERRQPLLALKALVVRGGARLPVLGPGQAEQARGLRPRPRLGQGGEGGEVLAHVVEDAVQDQAHPAGMGLARQGLKVLIGTQAGVDAEVVHRVVAVGHGGEDRPQGQDVAPQAHQVVQPVHQAQQAVLGGQGPGRGGRVVGVPLRGQGGGAHEPQGEDLPDNGVPTPGRGGGKVLGRADPSGGGELGGDRGTCGVSHGGSVSLLGLLVAQHQEGAVVLRHARRSAGQAVLPHGLDTSSCRRAPRGGADSSYGHYDHRARPCRCGRVRCARLPWGRA